MSLCSDIVTEWRPSSTLLSRFLSNCDGSFWPDSCVHYRGDCSRATFNKKTIPLRQLVAIWFIVGRDLDEGSRVEMTCRDSACINPLHMKIDGKLQARGGGLFDSTLVLPAKRSHAQAMADYHHDRLRKLRALSSLDEMVERYHEDLSSELGKSSAQHRYLPPFRHSNVPTRIHAHRTGPSQFRVKDAGQACTAIAFVVCYQFIKGKGDVVHVDWTKAVVEGGRKWRHWYDHERDASLGRLGRGSSSSYQGVYHLLKSRACKDNLSVMVQKEEYCGRLSQTEMNETGAYWPTRLSFREIACGEGAVLVCDPFSVAVLRDRNYYWLFDSHGNECDDTTSLLIRFDKLERVIEYVGQHYREDNIYSLSIFAPRKSTEPDEETPFFSSPPSPSSANEEVEGIPQREDSSDAAQSKGL